MTKTDGVMVCAAAALLGAALWAGSVLTAIAVIKQRRFCLACLDDDYPDLAEGEGIPFGSSTSPGRYSMPIQREGGPSA